MPTHLKARYSKGVFIPLEPVDLEDGKEVLLSIDEIAPPRAAQPANWDETVLEMLDRIRASYPQDMWDGLSRDLAKNKNHYLYGHPKEEERN